jgi:hypothetical protein
VTGPERWSIFAIFEPAISITAFCQTPPRPSRRREARMEIVDGACARADIAATMTHPATNNTMTPWPERARSLA